MRDLDAIFAAFRFGTIQSCVNIMRVMDQHDITREEFEAWVKDVAPRIGNLHPRTRGKNKPGSKLVVTPGKKGGCGGCKKKQSGQHVSRNCGDCDTRMILHSVNDSPCTQVGGSLTRQWICPKCGREDFE